MKRCVRRDEKGFTCTPCGKAFLHRRSLMRHVRDRHLQANIVYDCPLCGKLDITSLNSFQTHLHREHPNRSPDFKPRDYARNIHDNLVDTDYAIHL